MILGTITGYLGKDAEVKEHDGRKFVIFTVASKDVIKKEEKTTWVRVISSQENLAQHLKKGKQVLVVGRISLGVYNNEPQCDCNAMQIELMGKKENS